VTDQTRDQREPWGTCPDPEMLSVYLEGKLDDAQRGPIEEHVSRCEDCYFVVREAAVLGAEAAPVEAPAAASNSAISGSVAVPDNVVPINAGRDVPIPTGTESPTVAPARLPRPFATRLLPMAATLVIAAFALLLWRQAHPVDPYTEAVRPLVEAVGKRRFFDARLTGGFQYGERISPKRGNAEGSSAARGPAAEDWQILAAAAKLREEIGAPETVDDMAALAGAHLILGETTEAVRLLENTVAAGEALDRRLAQLLSDLSAAYLVRGRDPNHAEDIAKAVELSSRAVQLAPSMEEALFNRALALQALGLPGEARKAWTEFLRSAPPDSPWRRDALAALKELGEAPIAEQRDSEARLARAITAEDPEAVVRLVRSSPDGARVFWEERVLGDFGKTWTLKQARTLGQGVASATGDPLILRTLEAFEANRDLDLTSSFRRFGAARREYSSNRWPEARSLAEASARELGQASSPLESSALLLLASLDYLAGDLEAAETRIAKSLAIAARVKATHTSARLRFLSALVAFTDGRYDVALRDYESASRSFDEANDAVWAAIAREQVAEVWGELGRSQWGWDRRLALLRVLPRHPDRARRIGALTVVAERSTDAGWPRTALALQEEARGLAGDGEFSAHGVTTEISMARTLNVVEPARARDLFQRVEQRLPLLPPAFRRRVEVEYYRTLAETSHSPSPQTIARIDRAITLLDARQDALRAGQLVLHRALLLDRGDDPQRRVAVAEALSRLRALRAPDSDLQASLSHTVERGLDHLLTTRPDLAAMDSLVLAESRWESGIGDRPADMTRSDLAEVVSRIRPDSAVIGFVPARTVLLIWVLTSTGVTAHRFPVGSDSAALLVEQVRAGIRETGEPTVPPVLSTVFETIRRAVGPTARRLFYVAPAPLSRLPIIAVQVGLGWWGPDFSAVSIGSLDRVRRAPAEPSGASSRRLAAVAAPVVPGLAALPEAMIEARSVLRAFGSGQLVPATKSAVLASMLGASHLFFAGHAFSDPRRPSRSSMMLPDGAITLSEVEGLRLTGLRFVSLSNCSSQSTDDSFGDGTRTLSRAFLNAGAEIVAGTLWDVRDGSLTRFQTRLFASLAKGVEPSMAASQAMTSQRDFEPDTWSVSVVSNGSGRSGPLSRGSISDGSSNGDKL
jgi:tetratricopeptide (TPR) repeat protein